VFGGGLFVRFKPKVRPRADTVRATETSCVAAVETTKLSGAGLAQAKWAAILPAATDEFHRIGSIPSRFIAADDKASGIR